MSATALQASVLVLNRSFMPVNLVSVQRAFGMLFTDTAEAVCMRDGQVGLYDYEGWVQASRRNRANGDHDHCEWIRTVSLQLEVPRIIRLNGYDRYPESRVSLTRRNVLARDEHRCQYCGREFPSTQLSVDHVLPVSRGGGNSWSNVVCACRRCNRTKGRRTPQEANMALLQPPREPRFDPLIRLKLRQERYQSWRMFFRHVRQPANVE